MKCPICKKDFDDSKAKAKPFCSERCRLIDLGNWLGGSYRIAGEPVSVDRPDENEDKND